MLMPAAMLVVIVLGSIAVDFSIVYLAERDLVSAAGAAANDAVTYGADEAAARRGDGYQLDPARVRAAVERSLSARGFSGELRGSPEIVIGEHDVEVRLSAHVDYLFAGALPGAPSGTTVVASASAGAESR